MVICALTLGRNLKMKGRIRYLYTVALATLALGISASIQAESKVSVVRMEINDTVIYNTCAQENIHFSGELQVLVREFFDQNGKYHYSFRDHIAKVTGVGELSNTVYKAVGNFDPKPANTIMLSNPPDVFDGPVVFTRVYNIQMIAVGKTDDRSKFRISYHQSYQIPAQQDDVRIIKWEAGLDCK